MTFDVGQTQKIARGAAGYCQRCGLRGVRNPGGFCARGQLATCSIPSSSAHKHILSTSTVAAPSADQIFAPIDVEGCFQHGWLIFFTRRPLGRRCAAWPPRRFAPEGAPGAGPARVHTQSLFREPMGAAVAFICQLDATSLNAGSDSRR